jgi:hypothetical protein
MTDRKPTETTNLDGYGNAPLSWSRVHDILAAGPSGPDNDEHVLLIPGTSSMAHLEENLAAADIALDDEDLAALDRVGALPSSR